MTHSLFASIERTNKMAFKSVIFCASALLIQVIVGQSCYRQTTTSAPTSSTSSCSSTSSSSSSSSSSSNCASIAVSDNGGPLAVTSIGPIVPSGIAVATDLGLAGNLDISGALPYLSAVAFEGTFDTSGSTPLSYGCGDCVAITQEVGNPSGNNAAASSGISAGSINSCGRRS